MHGYRLSIDRNLVIVSLVFFCCLIPAVFSGTNAHAQQQPIQKPNIILILTDDQGIGDIGYTGNPFIHTPHLDALAMQGTRLTNFYMSPVCSPARASLLTGRYSLRTGVHDTYNGGSIMAAEEITLAEYLRQAGYTTGIFGKWHLGDNYPFRASDQGFDESLVFRGGGLGQPGDVDNFGAAQDGYFDPVLYRNNTPVKTRGYCSDVYTDAAIEFVEQHHDKPFFAYLAFNAPHDPLHVPDSYYQRYLNLEEEMKQKKAGADFLADKMNSTHWERAKKVYAMVSNIDDNVGRLMKALKKKGLTDGTIVIFMTDNGPVPQRFQIGLRGSKATVYEAGIRVPCFFSYNGFRKGEIGTTLSGIDILPTLLDLVQQPTENEAPVDGLSFLPLLHSKKAHDKKISDPFGKRDLFFYWQRGYPEPYRGVAVRRGDLKLVGPTTSSSAQALELYDLKTDPAEQTNIRATQVAAATELRNAFDTWYAEVMKSPHLVQPPRMVVGSPHQPVVVLNRNDAKGQPPMWKQEDNYGYWDIRVERSGSYAIKTDFMSPLKEAGNLLVRLAPYQVTQENTDTATRTITVEKIYLEAGDYRVECWYKGKTTPTVYPLAVTLTAADNLSSLRSDLPILKQ